MKRKIFSVFFALVLACSLSLVTAVPVAETVAASPGSYSTDMGRVGSGPLFDITDDAGLDWNPLEVEVTYADGKAAFVITPPAAFNPETWVNDNFALVFDADNDGTADFQVLYNTGEQAYPEQYPDMPLGFHWATKACNGSWSDYQPIPGDWNVSEAGDLSEFTASIPVSYLGGPGSNYKFVLRVVKYVHESEWQAGWGDWPGDPSGEGWSTGAFIDTQFPVDGVGNWVSSAGYQLETVPRPAEVWVDDDWTSQADVDVSHPGLFWCWDAFATIEDGINAVAPAGTVNVVAGIYEEGVVIDVDGLTLESTVAHGANIRGSLRIEADDVSVLGFKLTGPSPYWAETHGIFVLAEGALIEGNLIDGLGTNDPPTIKVNGIMLNTYGGGTVSATIRDNHIVNVHMGIYANPGTGTHILAEENVIEHTTHCSVGLDATGTTPSQELHRNSFLDCGDLGVEYFGTEILDATNNWWGSASGPTHASNTYTVPAGTLQGGAVSDLVDFVPWLNAPDGEPFAPVTTTAPEGSFASIQAGVTASNAAGTVNVAAGTYEENITIPVEGLNLKSTTLHGANIKGPVTILADGVTLEGFDILGYVKVGGGSHGYGDVTVAYNKVTSSGSNGIVYGHGASSGGTVTHNVVSAPGELGIYLDHDGGTFTVTHNTVEARKAIGFGSLSGGLIEYNTISSPSSDCDIEVFDASIATVNYNNLAGEVWNLDASNTLDATHNWWGDPNGPSAVSGDVDYSPWLPGEWELFYDSEGNLKDTDTDGFSDLDEYWLGTDYEDPLSLPGAAIDPDEVDTAYVAGDDPVEVNLEDSEGETIAEVDISGGGDASGTITGARYTEDPGDTALSVGTGTTGVAFLDVKVTGYTEGIARITVPYPDEDDNGIVDDTGIDETTLVLYYWDDAASMWRTADNNEVDTDDNTVSGDIPIEALTGTPVGMGGYLEDEALVAIESILNLSYSGEDTVNLTIDTNTAFLGAATIELTFDPSVVEVVASANSTFDTLTVNTNYAHSGSDTQIARFVAHQTGEAGVDATEGAVVAEVKLLAVGSTMDESPLSLNVITLKDNEGDIIPSVLGDPSIAIVGGIGDANRDGVVDAMDLVYIECAIAGFLGYSIDTPTMNVDGEDGVDAFDCTYLARHLAGFPDHPLGG